MNARTMLDARSGASSRCATAGKGRVGGLGPVVANVIRPTVRRSGRGGRDRVMRGRPNLTSRQKPTGWCLH